MPAAWLGKLGMREGPSLPSPATAPLFSPSQAARLPGRSFCRPERPSLPARLCAAPALCAAQRPGRPAQTAQPRSSPPGTGGGKQKKEDALDRNDLRLPGQEPRPGQELPFDPSGPAGSPRPGPRRLSCRPALEKAAGLFRGRPPSTVSAQQPPGDASGAGPSRGLPTAAGGSLVQVSWQRGPSVGPYWARGIFSDQRRSSRFTQSSLLSCHEKSLWPGARAEWRGRHLRAMSRGEGRAPQLPSPRGGLEKRGRKGQWAVDPLLKDTPVPLSCGFLFFHSQRPTG